MSLFSRIKDLLAGRIYDEDDYDYDYDDDRDYFEDGYMREDVPEVQAERSEVDMSSRHLRQRYVKNLCDLMAECTNEIDTASKEYRYVTDYLRDCEIIEGLTAGGDSPLTVAAQNVIHLMKKNEKHTGK